MSTDVTVAYNAVRAGTSPWAIFTVTAKDELKLEEKGYKDSTLDDLKEEFSDSKSVELRTAKRCRHRSDGPAITDKTADTAGIAAGCSSPLRKSSMTLPSSRNLSSFSSWDEVSLQLEHQSSPVSPMKRRAYYLGEPGLP